MSAFLLGGLKKNDPGYTVNWIAGLTLTVFKINLSSTIYSIRWWTGRLVSLWAIRVIAPGPEMLISHTQIIQGIMAYIFIIYHLIICFYDSGVALQSTVAT